MPAARHRYRVIEAHTPEPADAIAVKAGDVLAFERRETEVTFAT